MSPRQALESTIKQWSAVAEAFECGDIEAAKKARGRRRETCVLCDCHDLCRGCPAAPDFLREPTVSHFGVSPCEIASRVTDWLDGKASGKASMIYGVAKLVRRGLKALEQNAKRKEA
jgi:hypothetical protein